MNKFHWFFLLEYINCFYEFDVSGGQFSPDIAKYIELCRRAKHREYRHQQRVHYSNLLKEVLINRQVILLGIKIRTNFLVVRRYSDGPANIKMVFYIDPSKNGLYMMACRTVFWQV